MNPSDCNTVRVHVDWVLWACDNARCPDSVIVHQESFDFLAPEPVDERQRAQSHVMRIFPPSVPALDGWPAGQELTTDTSLAFPSFQAHRIISQVVFTGARVFGRAFAEAYKQASASQKFAAAGNAQAGNTASSSGLTLDEACRILNVAPPKGGQGSVEKTHEQFKRLFDMNDPKRGGSFYLQSKVLRARERIEMEVRSRAEESEREEEMRRGWRPKLYRDR
ncbi:hypothetical protein D0862_15135 [Hortaea werneckii]|uniref:Mitochondrial import inner membrane translocase subunit TIM16 n=1 Tax=Hortaea werneckii TaxID=91943 RepID=A0A3M7DS31_HORWE|nr:hypothetical protein D0862_15135 [Hortaea werneckii]